MAERFVALTRADTQTEHSPILVNLDNVAWAEGDDSGATRIVFAVGLPYERANAVPLTILVNESLEEIARLSDAQRAANDEAIAQAWADQTARRQPDADAT
jgi:hypothetical protein